MRLNIMILWPRFRVLHTALVLLVMVAVGTGSVGAQHPQDRTQGGAVFKIPEGYMRAPLTEFRGMFLLDPKKAAGLFVTYGNDNETTDALRQRILATVAKMFIRNSAGKSDLTAVTWTSQVLPSHAGDGSGTAASNLHVVGDQEVQVAIYERTGGPRPYLYGYFAMRHKEGKKDDGKFLDAKGNGSKGFDKLWKSFP